MKEIVLVTGFAPFGEYRRNPTGSLDRVWMDYGEATSKLAFDSEKVLLRKAKIQLETKMRK